MKIFSPLSIFSPTESYRGTPSEECDSFSWDGCSTVGMLEEPSSGVGAEMDRKLQLLTQYCVTER